MSALGGLYAGNIRAVLERGFKVIGNQNWTIVASGFFEPVFYLLAMGYGLGGLVGTVTGPGGAEMSYVAFIAPALLATSAMNGAPPGTCSSRCGSDGSTRPCSPPRSDRWTSPPARSRWPCFAACCTPAPSSG
ncbi:MAG: hypothetical protein KBG85_12075 [Micropruina sp.]|nr:hypothetical protein [Micropruina sp.]